MRSLEKHIEKIARKIAYKVVTDAESNAESTSSSSSSASESASESAESASKASTSAQVDQGAGQPLVFAVTPESLETYVGKAKYAQETLYDCQPLPVGIVMGLAWNPLGEQRPLCTHTSRFPYVICNCMNHIIGGSAIFIETVAIPCAAVESGVCYAMHANCLQ